MMMWIFSKFFKRSKQSEAITQEQPNAREGMLLGDSNVNWVITDFVINPKLLGLYGEIDQTLSDIFNRGTLDANNTRLFDETIETAELLALSDLNGQNALRPTSIEKMVAWREKDLENLRNRAARYNDNRDKALAELDRLKTILDSLRFGKKKGDNYHD